MQSREEVIWAAGLFEGEGCFTSTDRGPLVILNSTDEDVVRHFHAVVGVGQVYGPYQRNSYKPYWRWQTGSQEYAQAVVAMLWQWLHPRRREAARKMLALAQQRKGRWRTRDAA